MNAVIEVIGRVAVLLAGLAAVGALVYWAYSSGRIERGLAVTLAVILTLPATAVYIYQVTTRMWGGAYFNIPLVVQLGIVIPVLVFGWSVWLLGYGWLTRHVRHPLLVYGLVALAIVAAVGVADALDLSMGWLILGPNGTIWVDAALAVLAICTPIVLYELVRQRLERTDVLP